VTKFLLVLATVADLALAALLVGVSGFLFGGGPESMHAGFLTMVGYVAAVMGCLAAPIAGFKTRQSRSWSGSSVGARRRRDGGADDSRALLDGRDEPVGSVLALDRSGPGIG
jgi:hypothetical protein